MTKNIDILGISDHTSIKFCGLSRLEDIQAANELLPQFAGFVFAKGSIRHVTPERASSMRYLLDEQILAVGVFLDDEEDFVTDLLNRGVIDLAQLHGGEDEDYVERVQKATGKPVIKAFRIGTDPEEVLRKASESKADLVLLDSGEGGGVPFDWNLLHGFTRPFILAGGLTPENVAEAIKRTHPYAVDVSSGIETDGVKDPEKMRAFMEQSRQWQ